MPWNYTIDAHERLVTSTGWGVLTGAEISEHQSQLSADPNFRPDFSQLADFSGVTHIDVDAATIRRLAESTPFSSGSRRAYIAATPLIFGLVRMYEAYRNLAGGQERIRLFATREEALHWLLQR